MDKEATVQEDSGGAEDEYEAEDVSKADSGGEKDSAFEADDVAQVQSSPKGHTEGCREGCAVHLNILTHIQLLQ